MANDWSNRQREALALIRNIVPLPWVEFMQGILLALGDAQVRFANSSEEDREAAVSEALARALTAETQRLDNKELIDELTAVNSIIGEKAIILTEIERRFLATAYRCATIPGLSKFALLELGCAVEWSLLIRLFNPLQKALQTEWHGRMATLDPNQEVKKDGLERKEDKLYNFLIGQKSYLMLGDLVRNFTEASKNFHRTDLSVTAQGVLASWLSQCPNINVLRLQSSDQAKKRRTALHKISDARIAVAHAKQGDSGELLPAPPFEPHWLALVTDPEDAFFLYFPALFNTGASMI